MRRTLPLLAMSLAMILVFYAGGCDATQQEITFDTRKLGGRDLLQTEVGANPVTNVIDRSDWPIIDYGPTIGWTRHGPTYVKDVPLRADAIDVTQLPQVLWRVDAAFLGTRAENWSSQNAADAGIAPLQVAGEIAVMPLRMINQPPWEIIED